MEERRKRDRRRPLTRPTVVDVSLDEQRMRQLAQRIRKTGRFAMVRCLRHPIRAAHLRFFIWSVVYWPRDEPITVIEA